METPRLNITSRILGLFSGQKKAAAKPKPVQDPYHAVTISPGDSACEAAKALVNKRILSREASMLPLKGCDAQSCQCRFVHYDDRRGDPRRAEDVGANKQSWWTGTEADRSQRGRRDTDDLDLSPTPSAYFRYDRQHTDNREDPGPTADDEAENN